MIPYFTSLQLVTLDIHISHIKVKSCVVFLLILNPYRKKEGLHTVVQKYLFQTVTNLNFKHNRHNRFHNRLF
jgi:hypothetical protein